MNFFLLCIWIENNKQALFIETGFGACQKGVRTCVTVGCACEHVHVCVRVYENIGLWYVCKRGWREGVPNRVKFNRFLSPSLSPYLLPCLPPVVPPSFHPSLPSPPFHPLFLHLFLSPIHNTTLQPYPTLQIPTYLKTCTPINLQPHPTRQPLPTTLLYNPPLQPSHFQHLKTYNTCILTTMIRNENAA